MKILLDDTDELDLKPIKKDDRNKVVIIEKPLPGRPEDKKVSQLTKELLALDASGLGQEELAKIHGTSQQLVSNTRQGYNGSNLDTRKKDENLAALVNQRKYNIADKATAKLMESLDLFEPKIVKNEKLPAIAAQLAAVTEKVSQNFEGDNQRGPQFIIFAPRMRGEDSYEVININE